MNDPIRRGYRAGDADRERVLTALQEAYTEGRLDREELQERQEQVLRSRYLDELSQVLHDLPQADLLPSSSPKPAVQAPTLPAAVSRGSKFSLAIMSGRTIHMAPGRQSMSGFAMWGGNEIDLTGSIGPGQVITLTLHAIMGGHTIRVPEGVRIIDQSIPIMAGNHISRAQGDGSNGTLVLKGILFWAGNTIKVAHR